MFAPICVVSSVLYALFKIISCENWFIIGVYDLVSRGCNVVTVFGR
jgi:hypothetical protein